MIFFQSCPTKPQITDSERFEPILTAHKKIINALELDKSEQKRLIKKFQSSKKGSLLLKQHLQV